MTEPIERITRRRPNDVPVLPVRRLEPLRRRRREQPDEDDAPREEAARRRPGDDEGEDDGRPHVDVRA